MTNMRTPPVVVTGMILGLICMMMATTQTPSASAQDKDKKEDKKTTLLKTWSIGEPAAKLDKKELSSNVEVDKDGTVTLSNRGILSTKTEFKTGCKVAFTWSWSEGDNSYPDHMAVVLRSNGKQRIWAHEIETGLVVKFNPAGNGIVTVHEFKADSDDVKELARNKEGVELAKNTTYEVEITDTGKKVTVKIGGKVLVEANVDEGTGKVSLYNREPVARVRQVSTITGLTVEAFKKK